MPPGKGSVPSQSLFARSSHGWAVYPAARGVLLLLSYHRAPGHPHRERAKQGQGHEVSPLNQS